MADAAEFVERRACTGRTFFSADQWKEPALLPALQRGQSTFSSHGHASPLPWHLWGSERAIALALCHPSSVGRSALPALLFFCYEQCYAATDAAAWPGSDTELYFRVAGIVERASGGEFELSGSVQLEQGVRPALTEDRTSRPAGLVKGTRRLTSVLDEDSVELGQPALAARVAAV